MNGHICWRAGGSDMSDNVILRPMVVGVSLTCFFSCVFFLLVIWSSLGLTGFVDVDVR